MTIESLQDAFAYKWLGYGQWAELYWFVGMEPDGDEAAANLTLLKQAGRPELLDLSISLFGQIEWFGPKAKTQATWEKIIWLLLAYKEIELTAEATLTYQRERLGCLNKETTLIELSSFAAINNGVAAPRIVGRERRVATIAARLRSEDVAQFKVFYSGNRVYAEAW